MALDALVTALACLSSAAPGNATGSTIMMNSERPWRIDTDSGIEGGGCPVGALGALAARIQHMSDEMQFIRKEMNELQQLIDEYKSQSVAASSTAPQLIEPRIFAGPAVADDTPRDCWDQKNGQVRIRIAPGTEPFYVNCDQNERDGGWIVIAYRFDGSEDFNRDWRAFKSGFGALNSEFFIGLDKLHRLTNSRDYELLVVMRSKTKEQRFALYDQFSIGSEAEKYLLYVLGSYRGDAGDSLRYHAGKKFTTFDQDNDDNGQNCARTHSGAWWYGRDCFESNLFGTFQPKYGQEIGYYKGILWKTFLPGPNGSLRYVRMLIRPHKKK